jgi:hypothetical protein
MICGGSPDLVTQYIAVIDGRLVEYLLAKQIQIHTSLFVARKFWQMSNNGANVTSDSAGKQLDISLSLSLSLSVNAHPLAMAETAASAVGRLEATNQASTRANWPNTDQQSGVSSSNICRALPERNR